MDLLCHETLASEEKEIKAHNSLNDSLRRVIA